MTTGTGSTTHKFVVVLNKKVEIGNAMNAASHMVACLMNQASDGEKKEMFFVDYEDADGNIHPVSGLSLIVLKAKNSNQIRNARTQAMNSNTLFVDFTESMTKDTYVEQMERTKQINEIDLDYWGICMFGPKDILDPITKKFSLWN